MTFDMAEYKRRWRRARRAAGVCYDCGQPSPGFSKCPVCRAKEKAALAQASPARKRRRKCLDDASHRRKREAHRAAGVCLSCGGPRDNAALLDCAPCLARSRTNQKRRYARVAGGGRCYWCGTPCPGMVTCRACNRRHYERTDPLKLILKDHRRKARLKAGGDINPDHWRALKSFCGNRCLRCLAAEPEVAITIDHIVPLVAHGPNTILNVQPLCSGCNKSKNARHIDFRTPAVLAFVAHAFASADG